MMRLFSLLRSTKIAGPAVGCLLAASSVNCFVAWGDELYTNSSQSESRSSWNSTKANERSVRLNYIATPWPKVLQDLADKTDSMLVMHDVPPGKFSRQDWGRYTRQDAVNIINRDLEAIGFRVLVKDQFLTVMQARRNRPEYERPIAPVARMPQEVDAFRQTSQGGDPSATGRRRLGRWEEQTSAVEQPRSSDTLNSKQWSAAGSQRDIVNSVYEENRSQESLSRPQAATIQEPAPLFSNGQQRKLQSTEHRSQGDRQFAGESLTSQNARGGERATATSLRNRADSGIQRTAYEEAKQSVDEIETVTLTPRFRPALDIAKQIHSAFKNRSRLENTGPNDFPALVVQSDGTDEATSKLQFVLEIDTVGNRLLVSGEENVLEGLKSLVQRLDVNPIGGGTVPTLVAGNGSSTEIGKRLQGPLRQITQARQQQVSSTRELNGPAALGGIGLAQADEAVPPEQPIQNPLQGGTAIIANPVTGVMTSDLIGNLKGDVTIEALDDLDLLIFRGNAGDIEAVMKVIQRIEEVALGSLPEITLHKLDHVDSRSIAQLLNDIYSQLSELRNENAQRKAAAVNVIPVVTPNSILILAPRNSVEGILDLVLRLDEPVDPSHEVEVFRLKHAVASSVVQVLQGFYEEQVGLGTRLKVAADLRTNSVIVQARPRDLTEIASVIKKIDSDRAAAVNQMKIFQLKNAVASELAEFLNSAIQSVTDPRASTVGQTITGQAQLNQTDPKSVVLEFLAEDGKALARSGLLAEIRFNAENRTNNLAVTAPAQSLPLIEELIRILDRPSNAILDVKYFQLKNADAIDAVELLSQLFASEATTTTTQNNQNTVGVQLIGATDTASTLLPLRFVADSRTNSVIATGGADALIIVENLLYRLDATNPRNRKQTVLKLRNAPAQDVATAINQFLQSQRDLATLDPTRISVSQLLEQEVIVTPEPLSNNLLISATPQYFSEIEALAKQLDAEPAQVIIQALLVEVALTNVDEFGVEIGIQDPVLFNRSIIDDVLTITETIFDNQGNPTATSTRIISQQASPGFNFNNQPLGANNGPLSNPGKVGSQGMSNFNLARSNNDLGYGGLVLSASSDSVNVLIRALAARRSVRILSRPQILALDNQPAQIQVGQIVPVTDGVTQSQIAVTPQIIRDPAGIILTVTPRVSPEGQIVMDVVAEKSVYTDEGVPVFTDTVTGNVITAPIKNISTAQTTVRVPDGQTIVVGGMITDTDDTIERKVPWLGDLPIIGTAFRFDTKQTERTELLIFLTPRIVHNSAVAEHIKHVEAGRIHFFQEEAEEIHGPLFGVPNATDEFHSGEYIEGVPVENYPSQLHLPELGPVNPTYESNPNMQPGAAPIAPVPPAVDAETTSRNLRIFKVNPAHHSK